MDMKDILFKLINTDIYGDIIFDNGKVIQDVCVKYCNGSVCVCTNSDGVSSYTFEPKSVTYITHKWQYSTAEPITHRRVEKKK